MPSKPRRPPSMKANGLCSDCPDKDAEAHHHSVSDERKADCPECIDRAIYA
jgi:hypothetical protein